MKAHDAASHDLSVPIVKSRATSNSTEREEQPTYAVIGVDDIQHQVGLIQYPRNSNQFFVIAPYYIFKGNLHAKRGHLTTL